MPNAAEIACLPAVELRRRIGNKELSPVEVVDACLAQIDAHNPTINAVVTVSPSVRDDARAAEAAVARGDTLGPLHGIPVGIKDVTPVAGLRTTYGSPMYADNVPDEDALVVSRFREAGAIIVGKTNTPEFATGGNTFNEVFGRTRNPWNPALSAGGSTGGGAAALATGMIALAEGTDLGGSLRIPASFNGVVGMRPSPGLVPTYPSDFLWDTMQSTGPMARTAEDVALALQAIAGPTPKVAICHPMDGRDFPAAALAGIDGRTVRYCNDLAGIGVDPGVEAVCRGAAFDLETSVEEIDINVSYARDAFIALRGHWMVAHHYARRDRRAEFGANLGGNFDLGIAVTTDQLAAAERDRGRLYEQLRALLPRGTVLLTPCMAVPPFPVEDNYPETIAGKPMATYIDWVAPTFVISLSGLPAASVPCGLDERGLPVGLQVIGGPRDEEAVLAVARAIQQANPIGRPSIV